MIGASYDWRLAPRQLEERDKLFSKLMAQVQAMVEADHEHRPAVIVAFSLGCRIAKYFIHFCQAKKGDSWIAKYIQHFVPLGAPWLGAVQLMKTVMIDGSFEPLDLLFSESQMLTILRSVPVGKYLQPIGDWQDGLDLPFVYVREEMYLSVAIGALSLADTSFTDLQLQVKIDDQVGVLKQTLKFHRQ